MIKKGKICLWFLLLFGLLGQAQVAAAVPVYLAGEQVAAAWEQAGYTYLPLRTVFEAIGATVEWDAAEQRINATLADGGVLRLQVGSTAGKAEYNTTAWQGHFDFQLAVAPLVNGDTAYVPLRMLQDALAFNVDWRDNAVYIEYPQITCPDAASGSEYALNLYNGEFSLRTATGGKQLLGVCRAPGYCRQNYSLTGGLQVQRTAGGNYLLQADGVSRGEQAGSLRWFAWLPGSGRVVADYVVQLRPDALPVALQEGGHVWFSGCRALPGQEAGLYVINEAKGEVSAYNINAMLHSALGRANADNYIWWVDEQRRQLLLGGAEGFILYDLGTRQARDLTPELLNDAVKEEVKQLLRGGNAEAYPLNSSFNPIWQNLGNMSLLAAGRDMIYLTYTGVDVAESVTLHFDLHCRYQNGERRLPLTVTL